MKPTYEERITYLEDLTQKISGEITHLRDKQEEENKTNLENDELPRSVKSTKSAWDTF